MLAPHRAPYATQDGYVCVLVYNDKQWRSFFKLIGREEMFEADPRFSSQEARSRNISPKSTPSSRSRWRRAPAPNGCELLQDADIPVTPLNSVDDLIDDPHLAASGFFTMTEHPTEGHAARDGGTGTMVGIAAGRAAAGAAAGRAQRRRYCARRAMPMPRSMR